MFLNVYRACSFLPACDMRQLFQITVTQVLQWWYLCCLNQSYSSYLLDTSLQFEAAVYRDDLHVRGMQRNGRLGLARFAYTSYGK